MGKWIVVALVMCGLFFLGKRLMPTSSAIDTTWMATKIHIGMSQDEVTRTIGVEPSSVMKGAIGRGDAWYYQDEYNPGKQLVVEFVDGTVYESKVEEVGKY